MKIQKPILLVIFSIIALLFVLREFGIWNANLYKSNLSVEQSAHKTQQTKSGDDKYFSYHLVIKDSSQTIFETTHYYETNKPIDIVAILDAPVYSGNYKLPFVKSFEMSYACSFSTHTNSPSDRRIEGKVEGNVDTNIRGLCSRQKAKQIAYEKAKDQIQSYFKNQMNL